MLTEGGIVGMAGGIALSVPSGSRIDHGSLGFWFEELGPAIAPWRGLFVSLGDAEASGFIKAASGDLHRQGQPFCGIAITDGEGRQLREIERIGQRWLREVGLGSHRRLHWCRPIRGGGEQDIHGI